MASTGATGAAASTQQPPPLLEIPSGLIYDEVLLRRGAFGLVYKARYAGSDVAVKKLDDDAGTLLEDELRAFKEEAAFAALNYPCIVRCIGVCTEPKNLCIVMELATHGSLYDLLHGRNREQGRALPWHTKLQMLLDVACALDFLHSRAPPVVHSDLKSANVLVFEGYRAKVADFGLAGARDAGSLSSTGGGGGSVRWMAPEALNLQRVTTAADVYSFAMVMYEVLATRLPWHDTQDRVLYTTVGRGARPALPAAGDAGSNMEEVAAPELAQLMQECWEHVPSSRPSSQSVRASLELVAAAATAAAPAAESQPGGAAAERADSSREAHVLAAHARRDFGEVAALMREFAGEATVVSLGLRALQETQLDYPAQTAAGDAGERECPAGVRRCEGACEVVVAALRQHRADADLATAAAAAVFALGERHPRNLTSLARAGAWAAVLDAMTANHDAGPLQGACAAVLALVPRAYATDLPRACDVLASAMRTHATTASVQSSLMCTVMHMASTGAAARERLRGAGACQLLGAAARAHAGNPDVQWMVQLAVPQLCQGCPRNAEELGRAGVCAAVITAMPAHRRRLDLQLGGMRAALALAQGCPSNCALLAEAGACAAIATAHSALRHSPDVQKSACAAVAALIGGCAGTAEADGMRTLWGDAGACESVTLGMNSHQAAVEVQSLGAAALAALCARGHRANTARLLRVGACEALEGALLRTDTVSAAPEVMRAVVGAMAELCCDAECARVLAAVGAAEALRVLGRGGSGDAAALAGVGRVLSALEGEGGHRGKRARSGSADADDREVAPRHVGVGAEMCGSGG